MTTGPRCKRCDTPLAFDGAWWCPETACDYFGKVIMQDGEPIDGPTYSSRLRCQHDPRCFLEQCVDGRTA